MKIYIRTYLAFLVLATGIILMTSSCNSIRSSTYYGLLSDEEIETFPSFEKAIKITSSDLGLDNMEIIAEDSQAVLYYNPKTTEIAIKRKATGYIWYSNPQDRSNSSDPMMNAQFVITTLNGRDVAKLWNTFDDSVVFGQFTAEKIDQGITVTYLIGEKQEQVLFPAGITEERFTVLLTQMATEQDQAYLKRMYGRVDLTTISSGQQRENLKKTFYKLDTELGGVMYALKSQLSKLEQKKLTAALQNSGYTMENRDSDEESVGYTGRKENTENFIFSATYQLDHGSLLIQIDPTQIQSTDKLKISQITILRNFGAQKPGKEGFLFVPDGCGAIINTSVAQSTVWADYMRKVYGQDYAVLRTDRVDYSEQTYLPVYGAYNEEGGFLGITEKGDGQMSVMAGLAKNDTDYSYVCPDFTLLTYALVSLESSPKNALNLYPAKAVDDPILIKYLFYDKPQASYDDLAVLYRDYMMAEGQLDGKNERCGLAVAVNAIGAIDEIKSVLGYPTQVVKELTSFDELRMLGQQLKDAVPNGDLVINYTGWQKGGIQNGYIRQPKTERKLGSNEQLTELANDLSKLNVTLLPVIEPQYCHQDGLFDKFSPLNHAIRFITHDTGYKPQHNIANFYLDDQGLKPYIVKPDLVYVNMITFLDCYKTMGMNGIGLGALSSEVYSDFRAQNVLSVNDTIEYFKKIIEAARSSNTLISGSGANAYALFGLDFAIGLPVTSSNHPIITSSVPFLQILLSGSVSYTMPALNQAYDMELYLLKAVETGSGIYFDYFADEGSSIMKTRYNYFYAASESSIWVPGSQIAAEATTFLQAVANQKIVRHEKLDSGVYQTVYSNGITVKVNYNSTPWQNIPGKGYILSKQNG